MIVLGAVHKKEKSGKYKCKLFTKMTGKILQVGYSAWSVLKRKYRTQFWDGIPKLKKRMVEARCSEIGIAVDKEEEKESETKSERTKWKQRIKEPSRVSIN